MLLPCSSCGILVERQKHRKIIRCDKCSKKHLYNYYHTNKKYRQSVIERAKLSMKKKRKYGTRKDRWVHPDSNKLRAKLSENGRKQIIRLFTDAKARKRVPDSPPQRDLFKFLKQKYPDKHFEYNYFFPNDVTWYWLDIAVPEEKICIEVDGMLHEFPEQTEKDKVRDKYLQSKSWKVIRVKSSNVYSLIKQSYDILKC